MSVEQATENLKRHVEKAEELDNGTGLIISTGLVMINFLGDG